MLDKRKYSKNTFIILVTTLFIALVLSSCSSPNSIPNNNSNNQTDPLTIITITDSGSFTQEECSARNLTGKIIMLESKYCGACQHTMPEFIKACEEKGITPEILDLSIAENMEKMEQYNLQIKFTPTFIFGCDYYIGAVSKQDYVNRINKMNN